MLTDKQVKQVVSDSLRLERLLRGRGQGEVAHSIGISFGCMSAFEIGRKMPTPYTLVRICASLGIHPCDFLRRAGL